MNILQNLALKRRDAIAEGWYPLNCYVGDFLRHMQSKAGFTVWQRAMPAPICSNIHRINEVTNNRQQLLVEGFSFYAVAEISTTIWDSLIFSRLKKRHQNSLNHLRHSYNQICLQISVKRRSLQWLLCSRHWQLHQLMQKGQRWLKR